jgi:hypothetical protein
MSKRGPYTRKSLTFYTPFGSLLLEEKDALYQAMVELGLSDEIKAQQLSSIFNLGLLVVGSDHFVKLHIPQEARLGLFAKQYPMAHRLISAHDNLLSYRRTRKKRLNRISARLLMESRKVQDCLESDTSGSQVAADDEESVSNVESVLARSPVLFVDGVSSLQAVQISDDDDRSPLLPADRLSEVTFRMGENEARDLNKFYKGEPKSKRRKRGFVHGALYDNLFPGYFEIDHLLLGDVDIVVDDLKSKTISKLKVRSAASDKPLMDQIVELGESMPAKGTCRRDVGDLGDMFAVGYRSKAQRLVYKQTRHEATKKAMTALTTQVVPFLRRHYQEVLSDIQQAEQAGVTAAPLAEMGGVEGPGGSIMISRNLGNSSHFDNSDGSNSCSIWAEKHVGNATNWFFVLPNITINGSKGVVIKLRHGVSISWDGRIIRHCSSVTAVGETNNVYGCMFGSCRD